MNYSQILQIQKKKPRKKARPYRRSRRQGRANIVLLEDTFDITLVMLLPIKAPYASQQSGPPAKLVVLTYLDTSILIWTTIFFPKRFKLRIIKVKTSVFSVRFTIIYHTGKVGPGLLP